MSNAMAAAVDAAEQLLAILDRETEALSRRDAAAIEQLAGEKLEAVSALQANDAEALLGKATHEPGHERLTTLLSQVQAANERNGTHIAERMRTVERELSILHGAVEANEKGGVYTRHGNEQAGSRTRQITRA